MGAVVTARGIGASPTHHVQSGGFHFLYDRVVLVQLGDLSVHDDPDIDRLSPGDGILVLLDQLIGKSVPDDIIVKRPGKQESM